MDFEKQVLVVGGVGGLIEKGLNKLFGGG